MVTPEEPPYQPGGNDIADESSGYNTAAEMRLYDAMRDWMATQVMADQDFRGAVQHALDRQYHTERGRNEEKDIYETDRDPYLLPVTGMEGVHLRLKTIGNAANRSTIPTITLTTIARDETGSEREIVKEAEIAIVNSGEVNPRKYFDDHADTARKIVTFFELARTTDGILGTLKEDLTGIQPPSAQAVLDVPQPPQDPHE